ncbi:MAG: Fe-S cluster assembly protein SufD [Opitutaceae bacterium]|jgi:Fe-S cluster assembly protein SufD|nr:Fe-S cluster assembly protein SufD [Opitutaceae bacterium]
MPLDNTTFETHLAAPGAGALPQWWHDARRAAWGKYRALPSPAVTDEAWRFANPAALEPGNYTPAPDYTNITLKVGQASCLPDGGEAAAKVGQASRLSDGGNAAARDRTGIPVCPALPAGVIFMPLAEAVEKHGGLVREYLQRHPAGLGGEKYNALNLAFAGAGAFLYVPDNIKIETPLVISHNHAGPANSIHFPHTLVILGAGAGATVFERFNNTAGAAAQFACGVNDLRAGPGANLTYVGAQNWAAETLAFQSNSITVSRAARVLSLNLHLGGRLARHESHSRLQGPGAHAEMLALTVAGGAQQFDQRTLQTHQAPGASSNLLYKNALLDAAKTVFSGLIVVEPDAQKTDAYQSNRNLMLSDAAEAHSLPGLEIQANDVRCTHGATSARIPAGQEFYLRSRGIDPGRARELLVAGFFEEVLDKLENDELHAILGALIQTKFRQ